MEKKYDRDGGQQAKPVKDESPAAVPLVPCAAVAPSVCGEDSVKSVDHNVDWGISHSSNEGSNQQENNNHDCGEQGYTPVAVNAISKLIVLSNPDAPKQGDNQFND